MRKIVSYTLSVAFLVAGMSSCAKSTKGKVTNEWRVVSYLKNYSFSNEGGQSASTVTNMTENSFTDESVISNGGMSVTNNNYGTVNAHLLTIKKDGTWSSTVDLTYDMGGSSNQQRNITEQSGTWTFVGKTKGDDFKKNERFLLNILTEKKTSNQIINQVVVSTYESNETYLTGENVQIYTIKESKKKEMELELVNDVAVTSDYGATPGTNTNNLSINMTLKEK